MKKYIEGFLVGISICAVTEFLQASGMSIKENLLYYAIFPLLLQIIKLSLELSCDNTSLKSANISKNIGYERDKQ